MALHTIHSIASSHDDCKPENGPLHMYAEKLLCAIFFQPHCRIPCSASKIAQTWFSRLLFTVNKMSEGQDTVQFDTSDTRYRRYCALSPGTQPKPTVVTFHRGAPFSALAVPSSPWEILGELAIAAPAQCAQLTSRLEQLLQCSYVQLCIACGAQG